MEKKSWSDLSEEDKKRVIAWLRQESGTPRAFPPKEFLAAVADELENPTWG